MNAKVEVRGSRKRKIVAVTMDGNEVRRTTTLPLSHYWQTRFTCSDGKVGGMSGFASGEARARKAAASETNRALKNVIANGLTATWPEIYIVPVRQEP